MVALVGLLLAAPGAAPAAEEEQIGQEGEIWNLGTQKNGREYKTTLSAYNESCSGKRNFEIEVQGEAAQFLRITGPSVLEKIKRGQTKTTDAVLDLVGIAPGVYDQGTVEVRCLNCPKSCRQDYTVLQIHLTVVGPAEKPEPEIEEPSVDPGSEAISTAVEGSSADAAAGAVSSEDDRTASESLAAGASFSDSDGNGWNYCSGRCTKVIEKIKRADGSTSNVVRVKRGTCDASCSCVLFKYTGGKLDKKLEVSGDKGYVDIGQDTGKDYSLRCCEED